MASSAGGLFHRTAPPPHARRVAPGAGGRRPAMTTTAAITQPNANTNTNKKAAAAGAGAGASRVAAARLSSRVCSGGPWRRAVLRVRGGGAGGGGGGCGVRLHAGVVVTAGQCDRAMAGPG